MIPTVPSLTASAVRRVSATSTFDSVLPPAAPRRGTLARRKLWPALLCVCVLAGCEEQSTQPGATAPGAPSAGQAGGPTLGDAATGKRLMAQYQCGACHAIPGVQGAGGAAGPSLAHMGSLSYIAGRIPNNGANMVAWLRDPPALKPGTPMPALGLSEQEARHMAAYLLTLK